MARKVDLPSPVERSRPDSRLAATSADEKYSPQQKARVDENGVLLDPCEGKFRELPEDQREDDHRQERLQDRPGNADEGLLVAHLDVPPDEAAERLAVCRALEIEAWPARGPAGSRSHGPVGTRRRRRLGQQPAGPRIAPASVRRPRCRKGESPGRCYPPVSPRRRRDAARTSPRGSAGAAPSRVPAWRRPPGRTRRPPPGRAALRSRHATDRASACRRSATRRLGLPPELCRLRASRRRHARDPPAGSSRCARRAEARDPAPAKR